MRYTESVRGADVFVLQSHYKPINKAIMEQLIMIDALKRASARSITAVCPLLGYSRQDKKPTAAASPSPAVWCLTCSDRSADRIMSVDLHAAQSQGFFDGPVDHLIAMPVLVDYIRDRFSNQLDTSPSSPRTPVVSVLPNSGRSASAAVRSPSCTDPRHHPPEPGGRQPCGRDVAGKDCVLVDDLIDTAGTIAGACNVLKDAGAKSVTVVATHGVLSGPAVDRLKNCGAREVVLTDTVPIPEEKALGRSDCSVDRAVAGKCHPRRIRRRFRRRTVRHVSGTSRPGLPVRLIF